MEISSQSKQYIRVPVGTTLPDGTSVNPTTDVVAFAFLEPDAQPDGTETWTTGSWYVGTGAGYTAQLLVGPGAFVLVKDEYGGWIKITDNPEIPVLPFGPVTVY